MAREENFMMQEIKMTVTRARALRKQKKEWNLVHKRREEAHRQITAWTLIQGKGRQDKQARRQAGGLRGRWWTRAAVFSSLIYLLNEIGGTVTC